MAFNRNLYTQAALSVSTTELSIINGTSTIATNTSAGRYWLWIDGSNMVAGDEYQLSVYEKTISGGTARQTIIANLVGVQSSPFISKIFYLGDGWDFTIIKISGTTQTFDAAISMYS